MRSQVEFFVVVDAKRRKFSWYDWYRADAANLRIEEACRDAGHDDERRQPMVIRDVRADRIAGNFRIIPRDRKGDRSGAQNAEIVAVVRVLPDVLAIDNQVFPEGLLQAGMKLIAKTGRQGGRGNRNHAGVWVGATFARRREKIGDDWIQAAPARQN